jgi:hypothetical protein
MEMQNIKTALESTLDQLGLSDKIEECRALALWDDVASVVASRTQAVGMSRGNMIVNVTDSVVLHALSIYKKKYIEKINLLAGKDVIKDIIFRVGKIEKMQVSNSREDYVKKLHEVSVDQKDVERIEEIVSTVEDDEMRILLRDLFINQRKLTKMRGGTD